MTREDSGVPSPRDELRRSLVPAAAPAAALFLFYLWSAYPALSPYRDSGDLASAALTLGIAHPPGYPLYVLAARAWLEIVPWGSAAYRLHALSALCGASACGVLAWALARSQRGLERERASSAQASVERGGDGGGVFCALALVAALMLGLAPSFRHLSVVSEMYALNALFAAVLAALLGASSCERVRSRALCAAFLVFGLGLGNHQTLLAAGPLLVAAGLAQPRLRGERPYALWAACLFFAVLGLSICAYLPLRARLDPVLDWGDPRSRRNIARMLTRADYGGVRLHPERPMGLLSLAGWKDGLLLSGRLFVEELGCSGAALLSWGCASVFFRGRGAALLAAFLLSGPLFIIWANLDPAKPETYAILEPHLVLPLVFAALLAGLGGLDLWRRARARGKALLLAALAAGWLFPRGGQAWSHRRDFTAWDFGKGVLAALPPGSVLVDADDPTAFTLEYLLRGHGLRGDVTPLLYFRTRWGYEQFRRRHPELLPEREMGSGQEFYAAVLDTALRLGRPLYTDLPQKAPPGWSAFPEGLAYRLLPSAASVASARRVEDSSQAARLWFRHPPPRQEDFFSRHTDAYWASALNNLGIEAQKLGDFGEAARIYLRALSIGPWLAEAWNNLGNARLSAKDLPAAEGCYRASLREKPSPQVGYNLGRVQLLAGRAEEAEAELRRAADAGVADAANDLGLLFLRAGRVEDAVRQWLSLVERRPRYALAYYNLALAFEKLKDRPRALRALEAYESLVEDPAQKDEARRWMRSLRK